jgi:hypothetical protein
MCVIAHEAAMSRARVREDVLLDQKAVAPMAHSEMENGTGGKRALRIQGRLER